jgi:hypothetical protein
VDDLRQALGVVTTPDSLGGFRGVQVVSYGDQEAAQVATEFMSLYLQGVSEPTVTGFLERHAQVIERAFNADRVFYQPNLQWREGNPDPSEESIQPDVLLRRPDGTWVVLEFKLPLLDKRNLTKGGHRRRRFVDAVSEGIAQLFNYSDYFSFAANRAVAYGKLGDCPKNPELVLVIGNSENIEPEAVRQAQRSHGSFTLVDYDSFIRLYLGPDFLKR